MKWIRLWPDHILNGSTFDELTAGQRGVWFSLLALAGYSSIPGTICIAKGVAYSHEQLAAFLKLPLKLLTDTITHLASDQIKKLTLNIDGTITVTNWNRYQTEYDRQKPYRGLQGKVTAKGYNQKLQTDVDVDLEVRSKKKKEPKEHYLVGLRPTALTLLTFLNEKTHKAYQPVPANLDLILARLKEGATEQQCRFVIARKCREWEGTEQAVYLRPATLFNKTKFAQYVGACVPEFEPETNGTPAIVQEVSDALRKL